MASFVSGGGGGSNEQFIVTLTQSSGTYSVDKTFSEIVDAYNDGKPHELVGDEELILTTSGKVKYVEKGKTSKTRINFAYTL